MKKLDNTERFIVLLHCDDCSSAIFTRALARGELLNIIDKHLQLRNKITAKMNQLNHEYEQGKR